MLDRTAEASGTEFSPAVDKAIDAVSCDGIDSDWYRNIVQGYSTAAPIFLRDN